MSYHRYLQVDQGGEMQIGIIGATHSGLLHGATLAYLGHRVILYDADADRLKDLKAGRLPFFETGLKDLVKRGVEQGGLVFSADLEKAAADQDIVFLCVEPLSGQNGSTDIRPVLDAARAIAPKLTGHTIVAIKSSVPVGTCDQVLAWLKAGLQPGAMVGIAMNPDFVRRGEALQNALNPDRIVVGADSDDEALPLFELYTPFECPVVLTSLRSAELSKYAANAFLATKISFINGIAILCEKVGADVQEVADVLGQDRRIGLEGLKAGLGCGGSALFSDALALLTLASRHDYDFELLHGTVVTDHQQTERVIATLRERFEDLCGVKIAVLGLTYKPNTDDVSDSRAMLIVRLLLSEGAQVRAYDPVAMEAAKAELSSMMAANLRFASNAYEAAQGADAILVLTDWPEFANLNFQRLASLAASAVIFDARGILPLPTVRAAGFDVSGIGRLPARRMSPAVRMRLIRSKAFSR